MTELHVATNGKLVSELVDDVAQWIRGRKSYVVPQASGIGRTKEEAVELAVEDVATDAAEDLIIHFGVILASFGITADGEVSA